MKIKMFIVGVIALLATMPATAQNETYQHWSIVLNGGLTGYLPTNHKFMKDLGPTFGAGIEWTANPFWGISADYQYLSFENGAIKEYGYLNEITFSGHLNLSNLMAQDRRGGWKHLNLYGHFGLGASISTHEGRNANARGICGVIPAGFMLEYNISKLLALNVNLEGRWHTAPKRDVAYNPTGVINALATVGIRVKLGTSKHARNFVFEPLAPVSANDDALIKQLQNDLNNAVNEAAKNKNAINDANGQIDALKREIDNLKKKDPTPPPTESVFVKLSEHVTFDFDKTNLKSEFYPVLDQIASELIKSKMNVIILGHTDMVGTYDYNMKLSVNRAKAVHDYLVSKGVDRNQLTIQGQGFSQPLTDNNTVEGRQQNRRVEFIKR